METQYSKLESMKTEINQSSEEGFELKNIIYKNKKLRDELNQQYLELQIGYNTTKKEYEEKEIDYASGISNISELEFKLQHDMNTNHSLLIKDDELKLNISQLENMIGETKLSGEEQAVE